MKFEKFSQSQARDAQAPVLSGIANACRVTRQRAGAGPLAGPGRAGFTMVEVAISLAIIGFALVAVIGILPAGLNVQKENREETRSSNRQGPKPIGF